MGVGGGRAERRMATKRLEAYQVRPGERHSRQHKIEAICGGSLCNFSMLSAMWHVTFTSPLLCGGMAPIHITCHCSRGSLHSVWGDLSITLTLGIWEAICGGGGRRQGCGGAGDVERCRGRRGKSMAERRQPAHSQFMPLPTSPTCLEDCEGQKGTDLSRRTGCGTTGQANGRPWRGGGRKNGEGWVELNATMIDNHMTIIHVKAGAFHCLPLGVSVALSSSSYILCDSSWALEGEG